MIHLCILYLWHFTCHCFFRVIPLRRLVRLDRDNIRLDYFTCISGRAMQLSSVCIVFGHYSVYTQPHILFTNKYQTLTLRIFFKRKSFSIDFFIDIALFQIVMIRESTETLFYEIFFMLIYVC